MRLDRLFIRGTSLLVVLFFACTVVSCGTILYPERRGQPAGRIDVGVAVLDGLGLLIFFIPGIIAFAVDFATGAIYLPPGSSRVVLHPPDFRDAKVVRAQAEALTRHGIEAVVEKEIGQKIDLLSPETRVARVLPGKKPAWSGIAEVLTPDQLAAFTEAVSENPAF